MDVEQQRMELAVLMLMDMAPGQYKVRVCVCCVLHYHRLCTFILAFMLMLTWCQAR